MADKLTEILIREKIQSIKHDLEITNRHIEECKDFLTKMTDKDQLWEADYVKKNLDAELKHKLRIEETIQLYTQIFKDCGYDFDSWWNNNGKKETESRIKKTF